MEKKKLKLEILDEKGNVIVTHHFYYNEYYKVDDSNTLRLTITNNVYLLDKNGKILNDKSKNAT